MRETPVGISQDLHSIDLIPLSRQHLNVILSGRKIDGDFSAGLPVLLQTQCHGVSGFRNSPPNLRPLLKGVHTQSLRKCQNISIAVRPQERNNYGFSLWLKKYRGFNHCNVLLPKFKDLLIFMCSFHRVSPWTVDAFVSSVSVTRKSVQIAQASHIESTGCYQRGKHRFFMMRLNATK